MIPEKKESKFTKEQIEEAINELRETYGIGEEYSDEELTQKLIAHDLNVSETYNNIDSQEEDKPVTKPPKQPEPKPPKKKEPKFTKEQIEEAINELRETYGIGEEYSDEDLTQKLKKRSKRIILSQLKRSSKILILNTLI